MIRLISKEPKVTALASVPEHPAAGEYPQPGSPEDEIIRPQVIYKIEDGPLSEAFVDNRQSTVESLDLTLQAFKFAFRTSYDQLLCLPLLRNIQSLWYQEETARKAMKRLRGRAILADEVGLGKTIEAGLILKEYQMRGLVRSALILTPSTLVNQWKDELESKFDLSFVTTNDPLFRQDVEKFWTSPFILASIQTAKSKRHFDSVTSRVYDMIIVDEAHHLKNHTSQNWKLVNTVKKNFLLLLTATPVQNNLEELYNLVTLLSPGHLKTRKAFREEYMNRGNPTDPRNREKLRQLLKEVMIRNTRSVTQIHLPPRFAYTTRINPGPQEARFYQAVSEFASKYSGNHSEFLSPMTLRNMLEAAGSSHMAATGLIENLLNVEDLQIRNWATEMVDLGKSITVGAKLERVLDLLRAGLEQKIIFVNYVATLEYLHRVLEKHHIPHVVFRGSLSKTEKQAVMDQFKSGCPVLLSTGVGGEGHNLQFCHTMINFDLPWNPFEIEQRIGRIHRIGQTKAVHIYNFCTTGSIEDHILDVLDKKINMFELIIGEMDMILGRLRGEKEFDDMVYDIWVQNQDEAGRRKAFNALATRLKRARSDYEVSKELDEKLFREDFGI